jgi:DNA-binding transcriptional LysR family regulator
LRVLAPHAFGQQLLVGPLAEFLRRYPRVTVEWLLRDTVPDFIAEGVDCAILVGEVSDPLTVAVRLAEVPRIVVAAPGLLAGRKPPTQAAELASLPWLALKVFYHKEITLRHRKTGETCRLALRPRLSTDNLYAIRDAARRGLGVAVVSAWLVADDLARGDLVHLVPDWAAPALPVHVIYPYAKFYPPKLRCFVSTMRELVTSALGDTVVKGPGKKLPPVTARAPEPPAQSAADAGGNSVALGKFSP